MLYRYRNMMVVSFKLEQLTPGGLSLQISTLELGQSIFGSIKNNPGVNRHVTELIFYIK